MNITFLKISFYALVHMFFFAENQTLRADGIKYFVPNTDALLVLSLHPVLPAVIFIKYFYKPFRIYLKREIEGPSQVFFFCFLSKKLIVFIKMSHEFYSKILLLLLMSLYIIHVI